MRAQILAHAAGSPSKEICGLLFGTENSIISALQTTNIADHRADSFEIDPAALFSAIRAGRDGGEQLIGHYHSHPTGSTKPSPRDVEMALDTGRLWLIVADGELELWHAAEPGRLEPVELDLARPSSSRH